MNNKKFLYHERQEKAKAEGPFICVKCDVRCLTAITMKAHVERVHGDPKLNFVMKHVVKDFIIGGA